MFNLIHNNNLILGPVPYSKRRFTEELEELEITHDPLPSSLIEPLIIDTETKILPFKDTTTPEHNHTFEQLIGPTFTINTDDTVSFIYTKQDKPLHEIKALLKSTIASNRWKYETQGITINIQNNVVFIPTAKGDRDIFLQSFQLGLDNVNWKFNDIWLVLKNTDLQSIVTNALAHVQSCFDWEAGKVTEIDSCLDITGLKLIELVKPEWEPVQGNVGVV
jgi:hypothetical protein